MKKQAEERLTPHKKAGTPGYLTGPTDFPVVACIYNNTQSTQKSQPISVRARRAVPLQEGL